MSDLENDFYIKYRIETESVVSIAKSLEIGGKDIIHCEGLKYVTIQV